MIQICFVILHYMASEQTVECIETIKRNNEPDSYRIIVVDNCSSNGSGRVIADLFLKDPNVDVILNDANWGFAKGNNIGIEYARKKYNPDFVCCLNNDVLIEDKSFLHKIQKEYAHSRCGVIGPRIYLKNNILFRFDENIKNINYYKSELARYKSIISENQDLNTGTKENGGFKQRIIGLLIRFRMINLYRGLFHRVYFRKENIILHGCCLIFTPAFFERLSGFDERTFLYMEELLLYIKCRRERVLTVYNPRIKVKHLEDCSTEMAWGNKTSLNKAKFMAESLVVVINELENV